jgi:predicted amidohydrolase
MLKAQRRCLVLWVLTAAALALSLGPAPGQAAAAPTRPVTLVAVQMQVQLDDYQSPEVFGAVIQQYMKAAMRTRGDGPRLVAFPEDVGLGLLVVDDYAVVEDCASWGEAASLLIYLYWPQVYEAMVEYGCSPMHALLLVKGERVRQVYVDTFSALAKEHHVTIVAGSAPLPGPDGAVYNTSLIFDPNGKLIGEQRKVNLIDLEGPYGLDLTPGSLDEIHAADTPVGRLGVAICYDMFPAAEGEPADVVEALVADGAQILVQPSFNPHVWDAWQEEDWKRGLWTAVGTHPAVTAGVNPMMVGGLFDVGVEGVSSIIGGSFDPPANGYLAQAASPTEPDIVAAEVDVPKR